MTEALRSIREVILVGTFFCTDLLPGKLVQATPAGLLSLPAGVSWVYLRRSVPA